VRGRAHFGYPWGSVVPFGTAPGHPANVGKLRWRVGHSVRLQVFRLCPDGLRSGPRLRVGCHGGDDFRDGVRAGGFGGSLRRVTLGTGRQRVVLVENAVSRVTTLLPVTKVFIVALLRESPRRRCTLSERQTEAAWGHAASLGELLGSFPPLVAPRCTGYTWGAFGEILPKALHLAHGESGWRIVTGLQGWVRRCRLHRLSGGWGT
jgi:hypothetical protein